MSTMSRVTNLSKLRQERMKEISLRVSSRLQRSRRPRSSASLDLVTEAIRAARQRPAAGGVTRRCHFLFLREQTGNCSETTSRSVRRADRVCAYACACVWACVCFEWIFDCSNCCHSNGSVGVCGIFLLSQAVLKEVQMPQVSWSFCSGGHICSGDHMCSTSGAVKVPQGSWTSSMASTEHLTSDLGSSAMVHQHTADPCQQLGAQRSLTSTLSNVHTSHQRHATHVAGSEGVCGCHGDCRSVHQSCCL